MGKIKIKITIDYTPERCVIKYEPDLGELGKLISWRDSQELLVYVENAKNIGLQSDLPKIVLEREFNLVD